MVINPKRISQQEIDFILYGLHTFSILYLCLSSLSKSVGIAIFVNLYIAGSNRFNGNLCPGSLLVFGEPNGTRVHIR